MTAPAPRIAEPFTGLDEVVAIETPEMVLVSYTIAGVGSRVAAAVIDMLICIVAFIAVAVAASFADSKADSGKMTTSISAAWVIAIMFLVQFSILWGYYVLFEGLRDGQTPGKKAMRLRVVMDAGYSISFSASAVRNIIRLLDMQPGIFGGVGVISIAASRSGKRIGDMIAGTMVVKEQPISIVVPARSEDQEARLARTKPTSVLSETELDVLTRFVDRRNAIASADRARLAAQLATRFRNRVPGDDFPDIVFLLRLHDSESLGRQRGSVGRGTTGAARERRAIVAEGNTRWAAFAGELASAQRKGLKGMSEAEVSSFVARYRELSNDLARLRTATKGSDPAEIFSLSRLVAAGHNLIYRGRGNTAASVGRYLAYDVPREVRRSSGAILLSAALFFVPMAIAYEATSRSPAVANQILPSSMLDRAEGGIERARKQKGYIEDPKAARPIMGSMIIANNIQVAFVVFAFGITALGTIYGLVTNGIMIGGVLGLYKSKGIIKLLLMFVAPHSVLELSAITIAGGAGLLITTAVVLPGNRTRREALVANGKRAMSLITCVVLFLIVAGSLEGLVSPIPSWPLAWKVEVAAATLVLMIAYLSLGFRKPAKALPAP